MSNSTPYRGVNLGNWLVLEGWMKPALFEGTLANDEYTLCDALGSAAAERVMRKHRETFITEDDFRWIRDRGLNAIRLPIGYWLLEPDGPFVGGAKWLDQAIDWCEEYDIACNIDFHGLPGHQGPEHHSGRQKFYQWHLDDRYMKRSLDVIERVAQMYRDRDCVSAFTLVNEPATDLPAAFLQTFYEQGYARVRKHMPAERVAVIIAAFTEARLPEFHRKVAGENVLTDIHPYPCFVPWNADQLNEYVAWGPSRQLPHLLRTGADDLVVGEWSLGVAPALRPALEAMTPWQRDLAMRTFANGQLLANEQTAGWFFWSYKIESGNPRLQKCWSFRDAVEAGWMPDHYAEPSLEATVSTVASALVAAT